MKKLIILTSLMLILTGCTIPEETEKNTEEEIIQENNSCNIEEADCNKRGAVAGST